MLLHQDSAYEQLKLFDVLKHSTILHEDSAHEQPKIQAPEKLKFTVLKPDIAPSSRFTILQVKLHISTTQCSLHLWLCYAISLLSLCTLQFSIRNFLETAPKRNEVQTPNAVM